MSALETYIGTKIIQATTMPQHAGGREGYQVVYEDGYTSWSPKDVFERAYRPITLPENFGNLAPHQQRAVMEKADLDDKLAKLAAFTHTPRFTDITMHEQGLLMSQAIYMQGYREVLGKRIEAWA